MPNIAVVHQAAPTATGTQDYTSSGFGTPVAAMFFVSKATTANTDTDEAAQCVGWTDGTTDCALAGQSEHNQASSNTDGGPYSTHCILMMDIGATTTEGSAVFSAWITDGVRINWDNALGSAYLVTCVLFGGDITAAHADVINLGTGTSALDQTAPGFQPNVVIAGCSPNRAVSTPGINNQFSFGLAHDDGAGTTTQRHYFWWSRDGRASGQCFAAYDATSVLGDYATALTQNWEATLSDFDANGFSVTPSASAGGTSMLYLALACEEAAVISSASGSGTGNKSFTGSGFTPDALLAIGCQLTAASPTSNAEPAESWSYGVAVGTGASDEYAISVLDDDGAATTDTQSRHDTKTLYQASDTGTAVCAATFVSFDSDGYTLNYATNATTDALHIALLIGSTPTPSSTLQPYVMNYSRRRRG